MSKTSPGAVGRARTFAATHPLVAVAVVATVGIAAAAVTVTYTNPSSLTTSVVAAPVQFEAGDDSAIGRYVTAYAISSNRTYFTSSVSGIPEGSVAVGSYVKIHNVDSASHGVTLATTQVTSAGISAYTLALLNPAAATQATLTFTDASPSATVTIPAGETWTGKLTLTLGTAAGLNNATVTRSVTMSIT